MKPTNQVFQGLYGPLIVADDADQRLTELGVLPGKTRTLMLSDITVCKAPGENDKATFPADPALPWAGEGPYSGNSFEPTPKTLCESPIDSAGARLGEALPAGAVPNVQPARDCPPVRGGGCRVVEGQMVLANGRVPAARAGSPDQPGALAPKAETIDVKAGKGLRLQIINAAITRYFRLKLTDQSGQELPLFRVGGEGGLLNKVRKEGGTRQALDSKYDRGEIPWPPPTGPTWCCFRTASRAMF
jgi:FtsP/CotA-like multicopper oxidase with cupredoxin domain